MVFVWLEMLVYFSVSLSSYFLVYEQARASPLIQGVISYNRPFVYVPTRTNQPGRLGHSQGVKGDTALLLFTFSLL